MKISKHNIALELITALLFLAFLFPFFIVLINSAKDAFQITINPLGMPEDWSQIGRNIVGIWTNKNIRYPGSFQSSIIITVVSLLAITVLSSQAAWVLVRTKTKLSNMIFFIFVAAMVIPFQIVMFPLLSWFRTVHVVTGIKLLRTYFGMVLAYVGFGCSLSVFLYHGFIKSIPFELEEAAKIDGCNRFQTFYIIISPILRPIHATVMVLNGIWIWNDYLLPLLVLGKGNKIQTIPLAVANFAGAYVKQWDLILTAILMAMIPIVIFFLAAQKHIIKGMVAGSIK
ncbi:MULTISPECIES: carbohydrate ABC transporter permease [unclassified Oceanispirochaeta]|uniref:carbohydrate ABC transporter permease n=1 Tax=unclassified Oceanispirochaeta TaxID=2635722 RepID=UPI000E0908C4|nr:MULTISPECIES: carbohydrate ABC transporter permease [unclassified Oceanispirochaeta]MBF9018984.1 carbohydrate ABC transporter permease [Oceanispirochaeta sp. M2]NPD75484.1 carbohydrate ABC transporter permease [Oceanispirochaeta sp. M1]RDG28662.1 carbohydrate ABC transporter permease [Oceanispirochaeta sp. M1]